MRRALPLIVPALLMVSTAQAEDFSGFYGGLNAGYARGQERNLTFSTPIGGGAAKGRMGSGLPPSTAGAAAALHRPRRAADPSSAR